MRTTVNIDDSLLAEAKVIAARQHRTIGSVLEEALRKLIDDHQAREQPTDWYALPNLNPGNPGPFPWVDINDSEQLAELLGDNDPPRGT